jgi:3-oxoacyl-[acyl-carrier protein] reductase
MGKLDGRVAIVTGAASGIGRGIAEAFAEEDAAVAIADKNEEGAQRVTEGIAARGGRAIAVQLDVTDEALVGAMVERVLAELGGIDILVNNAGIDTVSTLVEMPLTMWQEMMDVNLTSLFLCTKAVLPTMIAQRSGRIVNIGGTYGHKGVALSSLYASSKWALRGLTRSVALEAGEYGVTANVVAPGGVEGPRLTRDFERSAEREGIPYEAVLQRFTSRSALGRLVTGDEVATAVIHLASDAGRNITGQDLIVDAGQIV